MLTKVINVILIITNLLVGLELQKETLGLISMITLNYWCKTKEQKDFFMNKLNDNERIYQEKLSKEYNIDDIFKNRMLKRKFI